MLILKGTADTTSVNGDDVIFRGEPRPFTSALDEKMGWEEVRQVPKYGKIRKPQKPQ